VGNIWAVLTGVQTRVKNIRLDKGKKERDTFTTTLLSREIERKPKSREKKDEVRTLLRKKKSYLRGWEKLASTRKEKK